MHVENGRRRSLQICGSVVVIIVAGFAMSIAIAAYGQNPDASPSAAQTPDEPMRIRVDEKTAEAGHLLSAPEPIYPPAIGARTWSGTVVLHEVIGVDGSVRHLDPISGSPLLAKAAMDAVKPWRYSTFYLSGKAVELDTTVTLRFDPGPPRKASLYPQAQADPWTASETVTAAGLAKELSDPDPAKRPIVACVGFRFLYDGGHVPGASFHGPASKEEGLADLKAWAKTLPKSSDVVLYCGCCPLVRCPNLRPAFAALHGEGFARLRVLLLPTNFGTDWAAKGYPVEKGK